ncbi:MAG: glycosyltransferase family 9 protein [Acidobacteria bacterium]|nr:glycosyltransferase family 9 protein [Acidobacteriota bacterium]
MKVLLIRLRLIGDVVFTTPAVRALRRALPAAHFTYLVEPLASPIVQDNPHIDARLVVPRTRGAARIADDLGLARRLRAARFDAVVDFHGGPRGSWLAWASGAPVRAGYAVPGRGWMYTHRVDRPRGQGHGHAVENQWAVARLLAPTLPATPDPARDPVELVESPDAARRVEAAFAAAGLGARDRVVIIHASAGNPFRRWPAEAFVDLVTRLATAAPNRRIILQSGPSDADAARRIGDDARRRLGRGDDRAVVDLGELPLLELHAAIRRSALFIGGDSGPLHIAATTPTPIVALYGPSVPGQCRPWRDPEWPTAGVDSGPLACRPCDQRRCVPGDFRCLTGLAPRAVHEAAERLLG